MEIISKNEGDTAEIARKFAKKAKPGDIFALYGDLGSGKTTFVKYFAKEFGVEREITSPTFVIVKEYPAKQGILVHADCYRLGSKEDAEATGISDYFTRQDTVFLIEWPEKIEAILPNKAKKIYLEYIEEKKRKILYDFNY